MMKERRRKHDDAHRPGLGRGARAFSRTRSGRASGPEEAGAAAWPAGTPASWGQVLTAARAELRLIRASCTLGRLGSCDQIGLAVDRVRRRLRATAR
jgi:hypothetical protein